MLPRVGDVVREGCLVDAAALDGGVVAAAATATMVVVAVGSGVEADKVPSQRAVRRLRGLVQEEVDEVKSRQQRRGQVNVLDDGQGGVVAGFPGVGRGQD